MSKSKFTHKGWYLLCPIYLNADDGDGMAVEARHEWLEWWFSVNDFLFHLMCDTASLVNPNFEPFFPFLVTGRIK